MGVYSVSTYGEGVYGTLSPSQFATGLRIEPVGYDRLRLNWNPPSGTWSALRLVRSSYGLPVGPTDGTVLVDAPSASAPVAYTDGGPGSPGPLRSGRFYYYTLFVYVDQDARWVPAAYAQGLVVADHGYGETMWDHLPQAYKTPDYLYRRHFDDGPLRRFMGLLGYQMDRVRSEADTLLRFSDIDRVSGALLPTIADSLGVTYEPELGMRSSRVLTKNAIHLSKLKGTRPGVSGVATAYTSFGAEAVVGPNLLLDFNDSSWLEDTVGNWRATGATLANHLPGAYVGAVADTGTLRIVGAGSGNAVAHSGTWADRTLIPVAPSAAHTASAYVRHTGTARTVTVSLVFYDRTGDQVGIQDGTAAADTGAWVRRTVTGTSPATARWAAIRVTVTSPDLDEEHLVGAAMLQTGGTATTWESGRKVHVYLEPQRTNLVPNPSLEVNTSGWAAGTSTTIARETALSYVGSASLRLTRNSTTGAATATTPTGTSGLPVKAGAAYTLSAYFRPNSTTRDVRVAIAWYTAGGGLISTSAGDTRSEAAGTWTRAWVTALAPPTASFAALVPEVQGAVASEFHFADGVLFEQTEFVKDYFDASFFPPSSYLWGGTAHASASYAYPRRPLVDERLMTVLADAVPAGVEYITHYGEVAPASSV